MNLDKLKVGNCPPDDVNVVVEVPVGGEPVKYEFDKEIGAIFVDRMLGSPMRYPGNYGFIPNTLAGDGDPLDVVIMNQRPLLPGSIINCRPIGVLEMVDEAGKDDKLIAVPSPHVSNMFANIQSISDLPEVLLYRVAHFFKHYKDLESEKWVEILGWQNNIVAKRLITEAIDLASGTDDIVNQVSSSANTDNDNFPEEQVTRLRPENFESQDNRILKIAHIARDLSASA